MTDPDNNYQSTLNHTGYLPRAETPIKTYKELGFKSGLEIHQQLSTAKKLFCRCPAGLYQLKGQYDAELLRHMRPTLSELGEYDGTALMEFKTRKNIYYRIKSETACTYDFDDTPPFALNREALDKSIRIALILGCSIVGELHITRKQYLDGSIPTGFQRTAIVGINGEIPLKHKKVRIIQLSLEEDSCREVSDIGHDRIYTTDRLGIPLIEMVTYPDMLTPDEVEEAGQYLRYLTRSTGEVNTGIGAARQDVNVSISGGTRVEIKGVAHLKWAPELTHNEAFRQKALLLIRDILNKRVKHPDDWKPLSTDVTDTFRYLITDDEPEKDLRIMAMVLPEFEGVLSHFTTPGRVFADEIADRVKVIACIPAPLMIHSEGDRALFGSADVSSLEQLRKDVSRGSWLLMRSPAKDMKTALETVEERCRLAFDGVPNETRKALPDGTTIFERVLPGPDRMYPDTDSAPIPILDEEIERLRQNLPLPVAERIRIMEEWGVPADTYDFLLRRNLFPLLKELVEKHTLEGTFAGILLGQILKHTERRNGGLPDRNLKKVPDLADFVRERELHPSILKELLPRLLLDPVCDLEKLLMESGYQPLDKADILKRIPGLKKQFTQTRRSKREGAMVDWILGELRPYALGNFDLKELRLAVEGDGHE